jgi:hypothetical protein
MLTCCCRGPSENRGKSQSPASSNKRSESETSADDAPSACGLRCHEKRRSGSFLWRPK